MTRQIIKDGEIINVRSLGLLGIMVQEDLENLELEGEVIENRKLIGYLCKKKVVT